MAEEQITLKIKQETEGNALGDISSKIESLKSKVAELKEQERSLQSHGNTSGAAEAHRAQVSAARELRDLQRERHDHERAITNEARQQEAIAKAQRSQMVTQLGSSAGEMAMMAMMGNGGKFARGVMGVTAGIELWQQAREANTRATAAPLETAALGGALNAEAKRFDRAATAATGSSEHGAVIDYGEESLRQIDDKRRQLKAEIAGAGDSNWAAAGKGALNGAMAGAFLGSFLGPIGTAVGGVLGGLGGGAWGYFSDKKATDSEGAEKQKHIAALHKHEATQKQEMQKQRAAQKADLGREVETREKLEQGDVRGARVLQDRTTWLREYHRVKAMLKDEPGAEEEARNAADAGVGAAQGSRAMAHASFVDARMSGAASARLAGLAVKEVQTGPRNSETGELLSTIKEQHAEAKNAWRFKDFTLRL